MGFSAWLRDKLDYLPKPLSDSLVIAAAAVCSPVVAVAGAAAGAGAIVGASLYGIYRGGKAIYSAWSSQKMEKAVNNVVPSAPPTHAPSKLKQLPGKEDTERGQVKVQEENAKKDLKQLARKLNSLKLHWQKSQFKVKEHLEFEQSARGDKESGEKHEREGIRRQEREGIKAIDERQSLVAAFRQGVAEMEQRIPSEKKSIEMAEMEQRIPSEKKSIETDEEKERMAGLRQISGETIYSIMQDGKMREWMFLNFTIGVCGRSGQGKSSIINRILGENLARTDVTECTRQAQNYRATKPPFDKAYVCDLPGGGTVDFPAETYAEEMELRKFNYLLIVFRGRVSEFDMMLRDFAVENKIPHALVRSAIDLDLENGEGGEGCEKDRVRRDLSHIRADMRKQYGSNMQTFLLSAYSEEDDYHDYGMYLDRGWRLFEIFFKCQMPPFAVVKSDFYPHESGLDLQHKCTLPERCDIFIQQIESMVSQGMFDKADHLLGSLSDLGPRWADMIGMEQWMELTMLRVHADEWPKPGWLDTEGLNFGICGSSGQGKSTFINKFLNKKSGSQDAARTGVTECTAFPQKYTSNEPPFDKISGNVWDFPGGGTKLFPHKSYTRDMGLHWLDHLTVVTSGRVTEFDLHLLGFAEEHDIPHAIIRTKIDQDLRNGERQQKDKKMYQHMEQIRADLRRQCTMALRHGARTNIFLLTGKSAEACSPRAMKHVGYAAQCLGMDCYISHLADSIRNHRQHKTGPESNVHGQGVHVLWSERDDMIQTEAEQLIEEGKHEEAGELLCKHEIEKHVHEYQGVDLEGYIDSEGIAQSVDVQSVDAYFDPEGGQSAASSNDGGKSSKITKITGAATALLKKTRQQGQGK